MFEQEWGRKRLARLPRVAGVSSYTAAYRRALCCHRSPKNRKALQKVFSNDKPKLLGFVSKVCCQRGMPPWHHLLPGPAC